MKKSNWLISCSAMLLGLAVTLGSAVADNSNPGVLPVNSKPYGLSYGDWGGAWWAWALSIPDGENPLFDTTGEFVDVGQSGPVWFLAGNFGGVNTRTATIPAGKALFFPILNNVYWAPEDLAFVEDFLAPHLGVDLSGLSDEEVLRFGVNWATDHATSLAVTIDGKAVEDPWQYRADSSAFSMELSDVLEEFGYPAGTRAPCVADGYWIMLRPLSPGQHTIQIVSTGRYSAAEGDPFDLDFSLDVTFHLTVE